MKESSNFIAERKVWSPQQDSILKQIITSNKSQKWSEIAKMMETQYNIIGRTGKQCRQRWHNQLDPNIKNEGWNDQEEDKLFEYHNKFGNKWAKIAHMLPGRTDNCIKNHFYCTLRKALRRINKFINLPKNKGKYKEIKNIILSKVIAVAEEKFERKLDVPEELIDKCCEIKNRLIKYSKDMIDAEDEQNEEELADLIDRIMDFNKAYKRKKNLKKSVKTENNKSSHQSQSEVENEEDDDNVKIDPKKFVGPEQIKAPTTAQHKPVTQIPTQTQPPPQYQITRPPSISAMIPNSFHKKPSLRAYLLTPSMEMQLQSNLPAQVAAFTSMYPNFEFDSPLRFDNSSESHLAALNRLVNTTQTGFRLVNNSNPNPVTGELRKIQSMDFENYIKRK